jgi:ArsR family transcriptional regulator
MKNNTSTLADTDVLLDVLGNETRRRILNLISHEPMYFNQLAKEIRTGQQAILRHVKILEDTSLYLFILIFLLPKILYLSC